MSIPCTHCSASLPVWAIQAGNSGNDAICPSCNASLIVRVFPALLAARPKLNPDELRIEAGEASCFYHLNKRAAASCVHCGRFVCALCAVDFDGAIWCPGCMAAAQSRRQHVKLENRRILWDSIALAAATWPFVLFFWPALPGSLATIFISLRYWKRPGSLVPRTKWRFVLAILVALAELAFFVFVFYAISSGIAAARRAGALR
jgi:hypothetical protein